jgi:hypothetical protein
MCIDCRVYLMIKSLAKKTLSCSANKKGYDYVQQDALSVRISHTLKLFPNSGRLDE